LITFRSIELPRDAEEHTELTVELALIYLAKLTFNSSQLKRQWTLKRKEKPDKLPKERFQSDKNEMISI
jgi:hypothetical protein